MAIQDVVIVDGVRTAFGRMGGTVRDISCSRLGVHALKGLLEKTGKAGAGGSGDPRRDRRPCERCHHSAQGSRRAEASAR